MDDARWHRLAAPSALIAVLLLRSANARRSAQSSTADPTQTAQADCTRRASGVHKPSRTPGSLLHASHERAHALRTYPGSTPDGTPTAPLQGLLVRHAVVPPSVLSGARRWVDSYYEYVPVPGTAL